MKSKLRLNATGSSIITSTPHFANTMCLLHNSNIQINLYKNWIFRKLMYARQEEF